MDLDLSLLKQKKKSKQLRRRTNLISSICFFLGCTIWTVSFSLASAHTDLAYQVVTYTGLGFLMIHAFLELHLDTCKTRKAGHSRYGRPPCSNIIQTLLFGLAVAAEGAYFYFYMEFLFLHGDEWYLICRAIYLGASHTWFLTSILTFYGRGCFLNGAGLDNNANILYLMGSCGMVASGWLLWFESDDETWFFIKWMSTILWVVAAVLYTTRDFLQVTRPSSKAVPLHSMADTITEA